MSFVNFLFFFLFTRWNNREIAMTETVGSVERRNIIIWTTFTSFHIVTKSTSPRTIYLTLRFSSSSSSLFNFLSSLLFSSGLRLKSRVIVANKIKWNMTVLPVAECWMLLHTLYIPYYWILQEISFDLLFISFTRHFALCQTADYFMGFQYVWYVATCMWYVKSDLMLFAVWHAHINVFYD